ncbi:hypothetical protein HBI65_002580 [Parastagonospora nodorum]|nr:hypothetical protein HBI65_002580 [Parastagonospora nodorum]
MISSNSMSQTNIREGYRITTLEVVELIENLTSYTIMLAKVRQYSAKVKIENLSNTLTLILSKTAQRQSSSVVSNRSTALITNKFSVASLTKLAILNDANITLVDAMHYSVVIDALIITLIKNNDDLLGTVNSYIKPPLKRCKTEAADSRHAKASRGRTKKDKDLEDSNTSSDVLRLRRRNRAAACAQLAKRKQLGKEAQLKKTRDKEELAKAKKEKEEKETHTSSTSKSCHLIIAGSLPTQKCKMRKQKATRQNITQLTITISYVLLKARERSTARAKGASPLTPNLNKQLQ